MKYYIPSFNLDKLEALVKKLSKKTSVKYSCDWNDIQQEVLVVDHKRYIYKTIAVELEVDYKVGDYELVAELEHTENGNIIRRINHEYEIPEMYKTTDCYCEHCKTIRFRKNTFLLADKSGNYKQVGKSCLNDYIGIDSVKLIELCSSLSYLLNMDKIQYAEDPDILEMLASSTACFDSLKEMANRFYQIILNYGYDKNNPFEHLDEYFYDEKFDVEVNKLLDVVNTDWYNENNEYKYNCGIVLKLEYIEYRHWRLLMSYLSSAMNYLQSKNITNEYVGNVGDRIQFKVKTFKVLFTQANSYHYSTYNDSCVFTYRILTEDKKVVIWKTEQVLKDNQTIKATIKSLNEYKGEKQTVVTRGSLVVA